MHFVHSIAWNILPNGFPVFQYILVFKICILYTVLREIFTEWISFIIVEASLGSDLNIF